MERAPLPDLNSLDREALLALFELSRGEARFSQIA